MRNRSFTTSDITNNFNFITESPLFCFDSDDIKRIRKELDNLFTNIELLNKQKHKECHELKQTRQIFHQQQKQQQHQLQHQLQQHQKLQQQQKHHYNLRDSSLSNSVSSDQLNDNSSKKEFDVGYDSDKDDKTYDDDMHSDSADSWSSTSDYDKEDQNLLDTTIESNRIFGKNTIRKQKFYKSVVTNSWNSCTN